MATHIVAVKGLEARVFILKGTPQGYPAYGIAFDEDANTVDETDTTMYGGYCHAEIVGLVAGDMLATRRGIEYADIWEALESIGLTCECDDED